jgi:SAM-dependent methyltransferase
LDLQNEMVPVLADVPAAARLSSGDITDVAGDPADRTQLERLIRRYHWTASYCENRIVLEVACGTGQGLGLLRSRAARLYAMDLSSENLAGVRETYGMRIPLVKGDAQLLPFADATFDVVVLLEAIYFLPSADEFLSEARRILRAEGMCLVAAINRDCRDFNPNHPLYFERYGAPDLASAFRRHGFVPDCFGIIPLNQPSLRRRLFQPAKTVAIKLNLIPDSKRTRRFLKRIVFGGLQPMPRDISALPAPATPPRTIPVDRPDTVHQVVLCAGKRSQATD